MQKSSPIASSQSLWDFALTYYARPRIAETCLYLQDNDNINVCLLIALRWCDLHRKNLSEEATAALSVHIQPWTTRVVEPVRGIRKLLKQPLINMPQDDTQEQIRNTLKQAELLAEKKLLHEIERWINSHAEIQQNSSAQHLERYLLNVGVDKNLINILQLLT